MADPNPTSVKAFTQKSTQRLDSGLLWTMTVASGVAVANIYYNQPMLADMMRSFHTTPRHIGLVATFTQIGYALGMPLFVPLGDYVERRRLVVSLFFAVAVSLAATALATNLPLIIAASFAVGVTTVIAQIMIPLATELSEPSQQGKTIGTILSGILLGVLLARTLSGTVAEHLGWRVMFWIAAALALAFALLLRTQLPVVPPHTEIRYRELIRSIWEMAVDIPKLRQVSFVAAMFFASFTAFWTTLVFLLETPPYHYGAQAAGLFGLVGATGVTVAPIAGRMSDRRRPRFVVGIAIMAVLAAFGVFWLLGFHLWGLIVGVVLLDAGVQGAQVANQSRVLQLRPEARNRVNTVYMISYFTGGSLGSLLGSWSWNHWHWYGVCATGVGAMVLATAAFLARGPEPARAFGRDEVSVSGAK
jgi:predicted MFS family arabinose efflux permease